MKCFAFAFLVGSSIILSAVSAGIDGAGTVNVGGSAPPVCAFRAAPRQLSATNMSLAGASLQSGQINITQLIDENTARLKAASIQIEILGICNRPHYLSLMTNRGGLEPEEQLTASSGTFTRHVNYRAEALWGGQSVILQTDATPGKKSQAGLINGPNDGALNLRVTIDGATNDMSLPTANGIYSDSLIVQIGSPI
jgi:hypothetical protein